jgi:MFS family permease
MGAQNFVANLTGAVAPALTGFLVDRTGRFYWPFLITSVITWVGALQWGLVVGPVEVVWKREMKPSISAIARSLQDPSAHIP